MAGCVDLADIGKLEVEQGIWSQDDARLGGTLAWGSFLLTALKAHLCYTRNRDYICKDTEVIIISDATGRLQEKSRWSAEVHQVGLLVLARHIIVVATPDGTACTCYVMLLQPSHLQVRE